jgi:hypothetical protein
MVRTGTLPGTVPGMVPGTVTTVKALRLTAGSSEHAAVLSGLTSNPPPVGDAFKEKNASALTALTVQYSTALTALTALLKVRLTKATHLLLRAPFRSV